jgi:hypothetical protein
LGSAEIDIFLNRLSESSIDRAIGCFKDGLFSRAFLPQHFDTRNAQLTCDRILRMSTNMSVARTLAYEIPNFWTNLSGLIHSSNLGMIEANITRVYCMQGALRFHKWLLYVVSAAVERESNSTWINKLACDVRNAIQAGTRMTFRSIDYLPRLDISREYTIPAMPFQFDPKDIVTSTMTLYFEILALLPQRRIHPCSTFSDRHCDNEISFFYFFPGRHMGNVQDAIRDCVQ